MPLDITSNIRLFADDAYIYRPIQKIEDCFDLQKEINRLVEWDKEWSMEFHPDKCKSLRVTNKRNIVKFDYSIHDEVLESVEHGKYLGVIIDKQLSWKKHIASISSKANQVRQFLQRNISFCSKDVKLLCYKTFIRPIVEYASTIWDPVDNKQQQDLLNRVQNKAVRLIENNFYYTSSVSRMSKNLN